MKPDQFNDDFWRFPKKQPVMQAHPAVRIPRGDPWLLYVFTGFGCFVVGFTLGLAL